MKKLSKRLLTIMVVMGMMLGFTTLGFALGNREWRGTKHVDNSMEYIAEINEKFTEFKATINELNEDISDFERENKAQEKAIKKYQDRIEKLDKQIADLQEQIENNTSDEELEFALEDVKAIEKALKDLVEGK